VTSDLSVSRAVIEEVVRLAAVEVPGVLRVGRAGPAWRAWLGGSPVAARLRDGRVTVSLHVIARPGQALRPLTADVRVGVAAALERLLGLEVGSVVVVVDGVGG
jgi:uncharacterized alkaline shock family protein YloU